MDIVSIMKTFLPSREVDRMVKEYGNGYSALYDSYMQEWQLSDAGMRRLYALKNLPEVLADRPVPDEKHGCPDAIYDACLDMVYEKQEVFRVFFYDTKLHVIAKEDIGRGTINSSLVDVREILSRALKLKATAMALAHNHPSGDPRPSKEDKAMTRTVVKVSKMLNVQVIDHVVVGFNNYYSFKEHGEI